MAIGAKGSMYNMLYRSFGAVNFAKFWQHWNPIFSYYLGRDIYVPLKRRMPASLALVATFVACGALHDIVTMLVRQDLALFFVPWFATLGICVVLSNILILDYSKLSWLMRAVINASIIILCLVIALAIRL